MEPSHQYFLTFFTYDDNMQVEYHESERLRWSEKQYHWKHRRYVFFVKMNDITCNQELNSSSAKR